MDRKGVQDKDEKKHAFASKELNERSWNGVHKIPILDLFLDPIQQLTTFSHLPGSFSHSWMPSIASPSAFRVAKSAIEKSMRKTDAKIKELLHPSDSNKIGTFFNQLKERHDLPMSPAAASSKNLPANPPPAICRKPHLAGAARICGGDAPGGFKCPAKVKWNDAGGWVKSIFELKLENLSSCFRRSEDCPRFEICTDGSSNSAQHVW